MERLGDKMALVMLAVAIAAAFTLGQKGIVWDGSAPADDIVEEETVRKDVSKGSEEGEKDGEGKAGLPGRVAREGKVLQGWSKPPCVVVDPGHGGYDPGKVGINDALEKDVNLAIACRLRDDLEAAGVRVVMTRQSDISLGEEGDGRKVRDLRQRIETIEGASPVLAVSIHQNSYPEEEISGAQVFYYVTSAEGQRLAQTVQDRMVRELDPENDRQIKDNNSYYLLKKTSVPLVIVECGFLSNWAEAEKLCSEEYQDAVAWAVYLGIMDYLEERGEK